LTPATILDGARGGGFKETIDEVESSVWSQELRKVGAPDVPQYWPTIISIYRGDIAPSVRSSNGTNGS
jgi:hypothetical protein